VKRICGVFSALLLIVWLGNRGIGQQNSNSATSAPLTLTGTIPPPSVQGRIDHFGFDPRIGCSCLRWATTAKKSSISVPRE
jgi:hypothetical protein